MPSRKSVMDDSTTVLLRTSAGQIAGDRRYRAPSLDREPIARVLSKAHAFEILSGAETTRKIRDLTGDLHRRASEAIAAHTPTEDVPADHPLLTLEQALIMMIAVDEVVSTLMVRRANRSKGFTAYLKQGQDAATKPALDQLAALLTDPTVRGAFLREAGLEEEAIDTLIDALKIQETRLFVQRFVDHAATNSEPLPGATPQPKRPRGRPRKMVGAAAPPKPVRTESSEPPETPVAAENSAPPRIRATALEASPPPHPVIGGVATVDELLSGF